MHTGSLLRDLDAEAGADMRKSVKFVCILVAVFLTSCDFMEHSHCEDVVISQSKSSDGKYLTTSSQLTCVSGGKFTSVTVEEVPPHFWSSKGGYEVVLSMDGHFPVKTTWKSPTDLEIICPLTELKKSTTLRIDRWRDITITYR